MSPRRQDSDALTDVVASSVAVQVRRRNEFADVALSLRDNQVTVADVCTALGLGADAVSVDGQLIATPATTRAVEVLTDGSRLSVHGQGDRMVGRGPKEETEALVEVAVVAGTDAGRTTRLGHGLFRIATGSDRDDAGWYLRINQSDLVPAVDRPWHQHAPSIEAVEGPNCVVTLAKPVDVEPGYGKTIHRPPRVTAPTEMPPLTIPAVPAAVKLPAALSWATLLAPIPIALVMAFFFRPIFALFAAMGPVIALFRWYESRRRFRRDTKRRAHEVTALQAQLDAAIAVYAEEAAQLQWLSQPSVPELWRRARLRSVRLWERRPTTAGFMVATAGVGAVVIDELADTDKLDAEVHAPLLRPIKVRPVPQVIDLESNSGVGIHGGRTSALAVARSLVLQLATLQGPADLRVGVLCEPSTIKQWDWVKWLPHTDVNLVATSGLALAKQIASRTPVASGPTGPVLLIVVDHSHADVAAVCRAAALADTNVRIIAVAEHETLLPAACSSLLGVGGATMQITTPELAGQRATAVAVGVSAPTATSWARSLTPLLDPEADSFVVQGEDKVSLLRLVNFTDVDELERRWDQRLPDADPVVALGTGHEGVFKINLTTDGPHALIAGTTGSGKSELLRTLVLGLAAECPPEHVNFVLVDFKGGGAFDVVDGLPHVAGMITDLDEAAVVRALSSLRAELHRRETVFRELGVSTYTDAVRRSPEPIARVLIVIDEFAALATDYPELMTSIIDLAARGRSLGMHLVLATQRPSGVVDAKIRANTNLRVALRVQDGFDSQDVIGTNAAARIDRKTPGRAIFSIGGDTPVTVQTAFSGAADTSEARCAVRPLVLFEDAPALAPKDASTVRTERDVLVHAILQAHTRRGYRARPLWSEPLPAVLDWIDLGSRELTTGELVDDPATTRVALGLVDLPASQSQAPWHWDLATGPLAVYGASAQCVGNTLLSVGAALASAHEADAAHLYVIDGDGGATASLHDLEHTGAYVTLGELDRIERTISLFEDRLDKRRSSNHVTTGPLLVLLIDNLASVMAMFDDVAAATMTDRLAALARDGAPQKIHLVIGARTARDIGHRLAQQMSNRIVLGLADPAGYLSLGIRMKDVVPLPKMRAIDLGSGQVLQLVQPPDLSGWSGQPRGPGGALPEPIRSFPRCVARSELAPARLGDERLTIPVGIRASDLAPAELEFCLGEHVLIVAGHGMGRSTALLMVAQQLSHLELGVQLRRVALGRSPLQAADVPGDLLASVKAIDELQTATRPVVLMVDDAERVDADLAQAFAELLASANDQVSILAATSLDFARGMRSWTNPIRAAGTGILLGGSHLDGDIFKTRLEPLDGLGRIAGRGHLILRGQAIGTQFAGP